MSLVWSTRHASGPIVKEAMKTLLEYAKEYARRGFSVIPVNHEKKPLIAWAEFQKRYATPEELEKWFGKQGSLIGIGIVTGRISGLTVIDLDTKKDCGIQWPAGLRAPVVETPRGFHIYCRYAEGMRNAVRVSPHIDIRGDGGYVVAPPTILKSGTYGWQQGSTLALVPLPAFPLSVVMAAPKSFQKNSARAAETKPMFTEGRRDDDLFHVANMLVKASMPVEEIKEVLLNLAAGCTPPFPPEDAEMKVKSAVDRSIRCEINITDSIRSWVETTTGDFSITDCYNTLQTVTGVTKGAIRVALLRLKGEGLITPKSVEGRFRKVDKSLEPLDWKNAPMDSYPLALPLGIDRLVDIYPGNIVIVAGASNSGKTAFCLNVVKDNMLAHRVLYFNSEMGSTELRLRLSLFEGVRMEDWKFESFERSHGFADVIDPDSLNIVDFLEVNDEFYKVGSWINRIHEKLKKGVAVVCLQKAPGAALGRGASFGTEKPRLYVNLDQGEAKMVKVKNWKGATNPNGRVLAFKLVNGSQFIPQGDWHYPNTAEPPKPWMSKRLF